MTDPAAAAVAVPSAPFPPVTLAPRRASLCRYVNDRNPFYMLSAVCMFAGCRTILAALGVAPGDLGKLIALIAALNVYEALLIGLALFLIRRRGLARDGWILLGIESLFLVDLTLLNGEVFTASLRMGLAVNGVCLLLALAKIGIVIRVLRLRVAPAPLAMIVLQLTALFGMAGVFKALARDGTLPASTLYAAWWALALIPVGWAIALRRPRAESDEDADATPGFAPLPYRLYAFLPFVSVLVHLCGANRVYNLHFHAANVAPVLLGLAVLAARAKGRLPRAVMANLQMALTAIAVLICLAPTPELAFERLDVAWTPLRLALLAAAAVSGYGLHAHGRWAFTSMATACLATAALGRDVAEMRHNLHDFAHWLRETITNLIPTTPLQWGVTAIVASFVLLGVGASVSLRKDPGKVT